jgi:hypothetical protein
MNLYDQPKVIAGLKYGLNTQTESFAAGEELDPGTPVFGMEGDEKVCYGAKINAVSVRANSNLVANNVIAVTVNGIALDPVVFEASAERTVKEIVSAVDRNGTLREAGIDAFFIDARSFALQGSGVPIAASVTVTGGDSQATFNAAPYTSMRFVGVVMYEALSWREGAGFFPVGASVPVQTWGKIVVPVAGGAKPADKKPAYVVLTGDDAGKFTEISAGNYDCGCFFRSGRLTDNLALVELRGMK